MSGRRRAGGWWQRGGHRLESIEESARRFELPTRSLEGHRTVGQDVLVVRRSCNFESLVVLRSWDRKRLQLGDGGVGGVPLSRGADDRFPWFFGFPGCAADHNRGNWRQGDGWVNRSFKPVRNLIGSFFFDQLRIVLQSVLWSREINDLVWERELKVLNRRTKV